MKRLFRVEILTATIFMLLIATVQSQTLKSDFTIGSTIYSLQDGEEFVYGKIGKKSDGAVKYTLAVVRKPNRTKEVYELSCYYYSHYGIDPRMVKPKVPKDYNRYDYYLIFNGKKFGPYDNIYGVNEKPDVDGWVNRDGTNISFAFTRGKMFYPVINGAMGMPYWRPDYAPDYAVYGSNRGAYSFKRSRDDYRLYEDGKSIFKEAKGITKPSYSDSGSLIYAVAHENSSEYYVYINHKKSLGPYGRVSNSGVGFIPGTEKVYLNTSSYAKCGDREYRCKPDERVVNFTVGNNYIVFFVKNSKTQENRVYEYNIKREELSSHGPYIGRIYCLKKYGKLLYYEYQNREAKQYSYIDLGGEIIWNRAHSKSDDRCTSTLSPNGDRYVIYKDRSGKCHVEKSGVDMNINGDVAAIRLVKFIDNSPIIWCKVDQEIGGVKGEIYYKDNHIEVSGPVGEIFAFPHSNDIYHTIRTKREGLDNIEYSLFKNGVQVESVSSITTDEMVCSSDGRNAFLDRGNYIISNDKMDSKSNLYVNNKIVPGRYGAPIWLEKLGILAAIKQSGNNLTIVEL